MSDTDRSDLNGASPGGDDAAQLLRLGEQLRVARPKFSPGSLARVRAAMRREIKIRKETHRPLRWPMTAAFAALVLLGLLVAWYAVSLTPRLPEFAQLRAPGEGFDPAALALRRAKLLASYSSTLLPPERASIAAEYAKITPSDRIPENLRFNAALGLVAPHLKWRAADVNSSQDRIVDVQAAATTGDEYRFEAHSGETWMREAVPAELQAQLHQHQQKRARKRNARLDHAETPSYFWTVDDPKNLDVSRAIALLEKVKDSAAARWAAALRCNNTALTMDVRGGYSSGKRAPIVLDSRAATEVTFKLYRVTDAAKLHAVAQRIGTDFIFADHAEEDMRSLQKWDAADRRDKPLDREPPAAPEFSNAELVGVWHRATSDLTALPLSKYDFNRDWYGDEDEEPDGEYFGDNCGQFRDRLNREYWPEEGELSSWSCGRKFEIPAAALNAPGAYVLAAEANGIQAYAPILVDPLSLTLRRCRDGVLVVATDADGKAPVAGAQIIADKMLQPSSTDQNGVAFARVFAAGDKPIVVCKDGRYAIGGFGKVFDGIYKGPAELGYDYFGGPQMMFTQHDPADGAVAQVFEDRHVVAAYTDRPVYRPGQDVQFKLIVRMLGVTPDNPAKGRAQTAAIHGFRDEDFDIAKQLQMPAPGTAVRYETLDSKGRTIAGGNVALNDFGSACGTIHLSEESVTGACALRVYLNGSARIVPDVFAVQCYRRSNFEVTLSGAPENLTSLAGQKLTIAVHAKYFFGKPVTNATAQVRLVQPENWRALAQGECTLSSSGDGSVELELPKVLSGGSYHFICAVTDDSKQTVTQTVSAKVDLPPALKAEIFANLPRFVPASDVVRIAGLPKANEVAAQHDTVVARFKANDAGVAELKLATGWWTLSSAGQTTTLFVYGPGAAEPVWGEQNPEQNGFVNLAYFQDEESGVASDAYGNKPELWALLGQQHAEVGGKIKVLLYAPQATRVLLTMEGRTVLDYFNAPLEGPGPYYVVEVPIRERHAPNFYLQGCIVGRTSANGAFAEGLQMAQDLEQLNDSLDPKWCRIDVLNPNAEQGGEKLNVAVECDAKEHRPGDDVSVRVHVTGNDGKPRETEVSVGAVDASIYAFGADRTATIAQTFADARPPRGFLPKAWKISNGASFREERRLEQMQQQASLDRLADMQKAASDPALQRDVLQTLDRRAAPLSSLGEMPVTQIPLIAWRSDFRETAAWQPQLRTGADGRLTTHFKLPDSLTRYRVTAVGLTRQTEIGVGRGEFVSSLPLSVQVFLPRFAVEGDRLFVSGLIHNNSDHAVTVPFTWEIRNATCTAADAGAQISSANGATTVQGKVVIAAHDSAHAGAWLTFDRIGEVNIGLQAGAANEDFDAEKRVLAVIPNGRPLELSLGGATRDDIQLPIGFVPSDLRLCVSRSTPSEALQGIGYLVDYPYGCVEQTMSRFLPAVMVKHAWQQGVSDIPSDVARRLPDVLAKGLARLYNFQHADGGWGWWEHDQTNDGMSVYVVYGLARCKSTGTLIDADVLSRGCAFLKTRLADVNFDRELCARGWQALALAGVATPEDLKLALKNLTSNLSKGGLASLALACRSLGLNSEAGGLRAKLADWTPSTAEALALQLNLQTAFGDFAAARITADALMAQRSGLRWNNTKDTSWSIEAMTALVSKLPPLEPARAVKLSMAGKTIFEASTPEQLKQRVFELHLAGAQIPQQERATIALHADWPEPLHYALNAVGYQHMEKLEPVGSVVRMARRYLSADEKPLTSLSKPGDCVAVHVVVKLERRTEYLLIEDRRPAGWEFAADVLHGDASGLAANTEFRDDRVCVFFNALDAGEHELVYYLRAETPGVSHVLPGCAYPMYDEKKRGETGEDVLEISAK